MIIKMQPQKSMRRKKQDPQSRDFTCRCGKTYLSYAAAYTHIKNKHDLDKQFLENLIKPSKQKLPRGRPKQDKSQFLDKQYERLCVVQTAILKMYTMLHSHFPKIVLQANQVQTLEQLQNADKQFLEYLNVPDSFIKERIGQDLQFISEMNRHFVAQIAAKLKFFVLASGLAQTKSIDEQSKKSILSYLNSYDFWKGAEGVNQVILESLSRWRQLKDK